MRAGAAPKPDFEAIVMTHHGEIHRYVHRILIRPCDAEDLSQETFLKAYRAWPDLPPDANHRAWLFAIATNLCRNHARSEQRRRRAHDSERVVRRGLTSDGPETEAAADQLRASTEAAIRALPFKQRTAFTLRKLHDLEYEAIGESIGCSAESARAHVFQALRKLRATLDVQTELARGSAAARTAP